MFDDMGQVDVAAMFEHVQGEVAPTTKPPQGDPATARLPRHQQRNLITEGAIPILLTAAVPFSQAVGVVGFHDWLAVFLQEAGDPADPVLRLLLQQIAFAHFRVAHLHAKAEGATQTDAADVYMTAAAQLTGEFRRLVLALAEYRNAVGSREPPCRPSKEPRRSSRATRVPAAPVGQPHGEDAISGREQAAAAVQANGGQPSVESASRSTPNPDSASTMRERDRERQHLENSRHDSELGGKRVADIQEQPHPEPATGGCRPAQPSPAGPADTSCSRTDAAGNAAGSALATLHGPPDGAGQGQSGGQRPGPAEIGSLCPPAPGPRRRPETAAGGDGALQATRRGHHRRQDGRQRLKNDTEAVSALAGES
jgi:hypothetical protein